MWAVPIVVPGFVILLALCEWFTRHTRLNALHGRKLGHAVGAICASLLPLVMSLHSVAVVAALFVPFMLVSRHRNWFPLIHRAERTSLGEVSFAGGILGAALLASSKLDYSAAVLVMGLADPAAAIAGMTLGRHRLINGKSLQGSTTFLAVTFVILVATRVCTLFDAVWISAVVTMVEVAIALGLDNIAVPAAVVALLQLV
jgi:dolichol kinase